jgi:hypothetical protein
MRGEMKEPAIPVSYSLLRRILEAFLDMQAQGAVCKDQRLMEDLDREMAGFDRGKAAR